MFEKLKKILIDELQIEADKITPEASLSGDLGINSLEIAELILVVEDECGVEIDEEDIHKFVTVGDVCEYLEQK